MVWTRLHRSSIRYVTDQSNVTSPSYHYISDSVGSTAGRRHIEFQPPVKPGVRILLSSVSGNVTSFAGSEDRTAGKVGLVTV